jgi:hypothetical protein
MIAVSGLFGFLRPSRRGIPAVATLGAVMALAAVILVAFV